MRQERPSFQFYAKDWETNQNLLACSLAAQGLWVRVMCLMHRSDEYGVVRHSLADLKGMVNRATMKLLTELVANGVMKGCNTGQCEEFIYIPRSGRQDGDPVVIVAPQQGPIWYSSRMVTDEYVRTNRGVSTRFVEKIQQNFAKNSDLVRSSNKVSLQQNLFKDSNGQCGRCGVPLDEVFHVEYRIPKSKGGQHVRRNLMVVCEGCRTAEELSTTGPLTPSPYRAVGERQGDDIGERVDVVKGDGSSSSSSSSLIQVPSSKGSISLNGSKGELALTNKLDRIDAAKAMRAAEIGQLNPSHPDLIALCNDGMTLQEAHYAATEAVARGKGFAYALRVARTTLQTRLCPPALPVNGHRNGANGHAEPQWRIEQRQRMAEAAPHSATAATKAAARQEPALLLTDFPESEKKPVS